MSSLPRVYVNVGTPEVPEVVAVIPTSSGGQHRCAPNGCPNRSTDSAWASRSCSLSIRIGRR